MIVIGTPDGRAGRSIRRKNIFIIGPASVGKSTTGRLLAERLGYPFVDIDAVFCAEIESIDTFLQQWGYVAYCEANSELVDRLLARRPSGTVFATPAGFLAHEESPHLVEKHVTLVDGEGIAILLLPSEEVEDYVDVVIRRQLARYPELTAEGERRKYLRRHDTYKQHGHIQIFSQEVPEVIVGTMVERLAERGIFPRCLRGGL